MRNGILLLKTLLLSTSQWNVFRHTGDGKKKRRIIGNAIGVAWLYAVLVGCCIAICVGYGKFGFIAAAPGMCALMISALAFVFTIFKTNGYLFNFREYDALMALPFETRTVAACKFLYMYVKSLPWYMSVAIATMAGYGWYARPPVATYPLWILLSLFLPVIPMLAAAFLGFLIAKISAGFRRTRLVQTVLTFAFVLFCFSLRFIIADLFKNNKVRAALMVVSAATGDVSRFYPPAGWFVKAVTRLDPASALLLIGSAALLFAGVFRVVGVSYRQINSALQSRAAVKHFRMTAQRRRSAVQAIAFKEFRRMTGSTTYLVNGGMGMILSMLLGIVTLVIGFDRIIATLTDNAPIEASIFRPAIPFVVHFFIGMVATTACSPSLEGRNYWIVQSLPIDGKTLYRGKMLFNIYLSVPAMLFSTLCLCVSAKAPAVDTVLYLLLGLALCAFSTAWGCVCGIRHMRLDWENEVEVIKQSAAVAIYMLPNMFVVMGLAVLVVILGLTVDHRLLTLILILIASALAALSYLWAMRLAERGGRKPKA